MQPLKEVAGEIQETLGACPSQIDAIACDWELGGKTAVLLAARDWSYCHTELGGRGAS